MPTYTEKELQGKDIDELKKIAKSIKGIMVRQNSRKKTLIEKILEKQDTNKQAAPTTPSLFDSKKSEPANEEKSDRQDGNEEEKSKAGYNTGESPENITASDKEYEPVTASIQIDTFLIQINKSHLLDYFGSALIYPVNYEERELARSQREKDAQSDYPNHLLMSDGFVDEPTEQQVLIEVSLTEFDQQRLIKLHEKAYLLPHPLPISRVNTIYFANEESQENSIASAKTFQDAFLPTHLFQNWDDRFEKYIDITGEIQKNQKVPSNDSLSIKSKDKFNRVLGMLAFMKNAEIYYANETCELAKYSNKYFKVLREINPFFEKAGKLDDGNLKFYSKLLGQDLNKDGIFSKVVQAIYDDEAFRKDIFKKVLGIPSEKIQEALKLLVADQTVEALRAVDEIQQHELVPLVFLFRFRDKEGTDKYVIKTQLPELVNRNMLLKTARTISRANIVLASLGLYYGYRNLPKDEEIRLNDKYFASFSEDGRFNIKYKLDNLLDRITIESVYQYCFWGKRDNDFSFLKDDKLLADYELQEGYSDEEVAFTENLTVLIKIVKQPSEEDIKLKSALESWWSKVIAFIKSLLKKKERNNNVDFLERLSEFVSLHEDGYIPESATKILELIDNHASYKQLDEFLRSNHLLTGLELDSKELDIWLFNKQGQKLVEILSKFKQPKQNESTNNQ